MFNRSIKANYLVTFINVAHPILLMLFIIRNYGLVSYSTIAYVVASVNLFVIFFDFGVNLSLTARFKRIHKGLISSISNTLYVLRVSVIISIISIIFIIQKATSIDFINFTTLLTFTALAMNAVLPMELYWSTKSIHKYLPVLAISKLIGLTYFVLQARNENLIQIYSVHLLIIAILQCFLVCVQQKTWLNFSLKIAVFKYLRYSFSFFIGKASSTYASNIPRVLLKNFVSEGSYAIYILYDQIYHMFLNLLNPILINLLGKDERLPIGKIQRLRSIRKKTFFGILALNALAIFVLICVASVNYHYNLFQIDVELMVLFAVLLNIKIASSVLGLPAHAILGLSVASNIDTILGSIAIVVILNIMLLLDMLSVSSALGSIIIIELLVLSKRCKRLFSYVHG